MSHYENGWASLVKFCQEKIVELKDLGVTSDMTYFDFDSFADNQELPNNDIMGLVGYSQNKDEKFVYYDCIINVSPKNDDQYGTKRRKIIGHLDNILKPHAIIPLVNHETGVILGSLIVLSGVEIMPPLRTLERGVTGIGVSFACDVTSQ